MSYQDRSKTYRPRLSRDTKKRAERAAEQLTGKDVNDLPAALDILLSYFDVLNNTVNCPDCGEPTDHYGKGHYHCWHCDAYHDVWYILDADTDNTDIPHIPRHD